MLIRHLPAQDTLNFERRPDGPDGARASHANLITHVKDRPGHDQRYALDARKTQSELGWNAQINFDTGLEDTVRWFLAAYGA